MLEDIRTEKAEKFKELEKGTAEYDEWFLKYNPNNNRKKTRNPMKTVKNSIIQSTGIKRQQRQQRKPKSVNKKPYKKKRTAKKKKVEKNFIF
jgi:hypothetical protein